MNECERRKCKFWVKDHCADTEEYVDENGDPICRYNSRAMLNDFSKARSTIRQCFERDEDFRRTYRDNIAMLLFDRYGIRDHSTRNAAAEDIIDLIFSS